MSEAQEFKPGPGDVVTLRSGGANMTVEEVTHVDAVPKVICVWLDAKADYHRREFSPSVLKPWDQPL